MADTKITDISHTNLIKNIKRLNELADSFDVDTIMDDASKAIDDNDGNMAAQTKIVNDETKKAMEQVKTMIYKTSETLENIEKILKERDSLK